MMGRYKDRLTFRCWLLNKFGLPHPLVVACVGIWPSFDHPNKVTRFIAFLVSRYAYLFSYI
jgi:hypothetical protein